MQIEVISSGSHGNAITVSDGHSTLLLDCGLAYRKLARRVKCSELAGVLVTHEHMDHCKAAEELARRGIDIYMSMGTWTAIDVTFVVLDPFILKHLSQIQIGSWYVLPFDVVHDAAEPMGFLLQSKETGGKAVYIVDSGFVQYDFQGVTHYLIEANYSEDLLEDGSYEKYLKDRVRGNHFNLENLKVFLRTSDLSKTEEIWLLHLSDSNSDEAAFVQEIEQLTGVPVYTGYTIPSVTIPTD